MVLVTDVDAKKQLAAILAALNTRLNALVTPWMAYDNDKVPTPRPTTYVDVVLYRRPGGGRRQTGWAFTTRLVSTSGANARLLHKLCHEVFDLQRLTIDGRLTSEIEFVTEDPIAEDGADWNVGTVLWHYTHGGNVNA